MFPCPSPPAPPATSPRAVLARSVAGRTSPPSNEEDPPMTLNVGVIGVGMIGQDHIRRLTHMLSGARVAAVTDVDLDRAKAVGSELPGARVHENGQDLIRDDEVDA